MRGARGDRPSRKGRWTDGDEHGSWDPQPDPWGRRGGRVDATAIMTLDDRVLGAR